MLSGTTTVNVAGYGVFEVQTERVNELLNLLRSIQACKVNCNPVREQSAWGGQQLLNEKKGYAE